MLLSMFGLSLAGAEAIGWFVQALSPVLFSPTDHLSEG